MRKLVLLLLLLAAAIAAQKTVPVRTYMPKDGTVVHAHTRSAPVTKLSTLPKASASNAPSSADRKVSPMPAAAHPRYSRGRIVRSASTKPQFEATHRAPATEKISGDCPGYVIDPVTPLARGGADAPSTMQWPTVANTGEPIGSLRRPSH